jgi:hypothetical protein
VILENCDDSTEIRAIEQIETVMVERGFLWVYQLPVKPSGAFKIPLLEMRYDAGQTLLTQPFKFSMIALQKSFVSSNESGKALTSSTIIGIRSGNRSTRTICKPSCICTRRRSAIAELAG